MSYAANKRPTSHLPNPTTTARQPSTGTGTSTGSGSGSASTQQSSALVARIASKRSELDHLKQLQDLSGAMAAQMSTLEAKLATLRDGTEAVACVLENWENVLRAISMASLKVPQPATTSTATEDGDGSGGGEKDEKEKLPVTLVRIPVQPQNGGE